ncbi:MAG: tRNA(Ile)(2)-agmatinylcytidine synthase [Candidatus Hadarchaeales archaeon]
MSESLPLHVGIDDTDSKKGMCTTYVGAVAITRLREAGFQTIGFPKLIRLNPNIKWKTRGNCAISFSISSPGRRLEEAKRIVLKTVAELAELEEKNTTPGVAFLSSQEIPKELVDFSKRVVRDVIEIEEAEAVAEEVGAELHKFKLGRGVVGALAAIGHPLDTDPTFELIAYRTPENRGKPRKVDEASVVEMNRKTFPRTFDNLDPFTREIRITPHTPCPILYGIRGETPEAVEEAAQMVRVFEPIEQTIIYKTNQATDEHLIPAKISEITPGRSYSVNVKVISRPKVIPGGHVIFRVADETGEMDCAAYEPTRGFRDVVRQLLPGDLLVVHGGVKDKEGLPLTLNLEKLEVIELAKPTIKRNPLCESCGKRMKSEGRGKGYSCKKCGRKAPPSAAETIKIERHLPTGFFEVPPRARRHLSRPLIRMKTPEH